LNIGLIISAISVARIVLSALIKERLSNKVFRKKVMLLSVLGLMATSLYRYYVPESILLTNALMALSYVGFQLGAQTAVINGLKGGKTYYSSMILQVNTFATRIIVYLLAFIIGLRSIILLSVAAGTAYLALNHVKRAAVLKNYVLAKVKI